MEHLHFEEANLTIASLAQVTKEISTQVSTSFGLSTVTNSPAFSASTLTSTSTSASDSDESSLPSVQSILLSILFIIIIVVTAVGNILVCIAVCMVRKLRRPCNYLLVSLAVSDLFVAILVMPTASVNDVFPEFPFGTVFCDIWISFDQISCTASILNLCAISLDRYWAITKPLEYGVKRTPRRMMLCVALVWLGAACISLPPLLILGNLHVDKHTGLKMCLVNQDPRYQIYATLGSFYIPLAVMLFVYFQIFRAARRIVLDEKRAQTRLENTMNGGAKEKPIETSGGTIIGSPHQKKLRFQLAKERKASTTLGIIMSAFTICWLPFFVLAIVRAFFGDSENPLVPQVVTSLFLWLGYANSLLNPVIYATLNRDFRKPFQEILYFRCSSLNLMMREDFYHSQYGEPTSQRVVVGGEGHGARESFL